MMKKKSTILVVLFVILLLFIVGCGGKVEDVSNSPFLGGSSGLELEFLKDAPPNEITDGDTFPFKVVLKIINKGEFNGLPADRVRVDLKGFLPSDFGVDNDDLVDKHPESVPTSRRKDSEGNIIDPVETFVTIPPGIKDLQLAKDKISGNTEFIFRADVCYQYQTDVISKICILENMISPVDDAICHPRGDRKVFSSSSPIQVSGFRQTVVGASKIQFSFDIQHVGSGKIFQNKEPTDTQGCPRDLTNKRREENLVDVIVNTGLGSNVLNCVSLGSGGISSIQQGSVKLVNGKRTLTCTQEIGDNFKIDLERNVDITLNFDYSESVENIILARHLDYPTASPSLGSSGTQDGTGSTATQACNGDIGGFTNTVCRSTTAGSSGTCSDYGSGCFGISANICTCNSGLTQCAGTCAQNPVGSSGGETNDDTSEPEIGDIQPHVAVLGGSQTFVVRDVYDPQSGVSSCRLFVENNRLNEPGIGHNGPSECRDLNPKQCDFYRGVNLLDETKTGDPLNFALTPFELQAECTNGATPGVPFIRKQLITLKEKIEQQDWPGVVAIDATGPEIGTLVTNVAKLDEGQLFLITGIQDPSGVDSCEIVRGGGMYPTPLLTLEGPKPCMGEAKNSDIGGGESRHGACTASFVHEYTSQPKRNSALEIIETATGTGGISITISCKDRKQNVNTKQVTVQFI